MSEPSATARIEVAAAPETVYELVSDLPGMVTLAAELSGGEWLDGVREARVGARFRGRNRQGWRSWSTTATVTEAERGRRFAFDIHSVAGIPVARWQYDIEPTETGCVVSEHTWDRRPAWFRPVADLITGVRDRSAVNRENMAHTLRQVKAAAEAARG